MANEYNFNDTPEIINEPVEIGGEEGIAGGPENGESTILEDIQGLTQAEINDPNKIKVTIDDNTTPIVVLFGPPACGKTMTLVRMTQFLQDKGYTVEPDRSFRPSADKHYKQMCDNFNTMIDQMDAAKSTSLISFMLVTVRDKRGKPICQILEAPGELYYVPGNSNVTFPNYLNTVKNATNRKVWCFMVEPNWMDTQDRKGYADRIAKFKRSLDPRDKSIFIYNKIDKTSFAQGQGKINEAAAKDDITKRYKNIFEPFRSKSLLFGYNDNFDFVPFQTGDYSEAMDGSVVYSPGPDIYPNKLWNIILKRIGR